MTEATEKIEVESGAKITSATGIAHLQKDASYFTKKKSKKKKIFFVLLTLLLIATAVYFMMPKSNVKMVMMQPLARQDLVNQIGLSGVIKSEEESRVYTSLSGLRVKQIHVKVGDRVNAGDLLAQLDTEDLEMEAAKLKANMSQQERLNALNLEQAQKEYDQLSSDLKIELDSQVLAAKQQLDNAQREFADARLDMQAHKNDLEHADEIMYEVEKRLNRARDDWQDAEKKLAKLEKDTEEYRQQAKVVEDALTKYEEVLREWQQKDAAYGADLGTYSKTYRRTRLSYENAMDNYKIAQENAKRRLNNAKDTIEKAQISGEMTAEQITLQQNSKKIAQSKITAPISGTVTAVYAKEGEPVGAGMLFIIEDTEKLVVKTKIREVDIANVQQGMSALIKTDATEEQLFEGEVSYISPTAIKDPNGNVSAQGNVEFETDIALEPQEDGLRVGMNARVDVIIDKKEQVLAVPFEALAMDENGQQIIYAARPDEQGVLRAKPIPVQVGLETDFHVEISGEGLVEGENIITDASAVMPDMPIAPMPQNKMGMAVLGG